MRLSTRDPITEARSEGRLRPSVYSTAAYAGSPAANAGATGPADPAAAATDSLQPPEAVQKPRVTPAAYRALLASMGPPAAPPAVPAAAAPPAAAVGRRQAATEAPMLRADPADAVTGGGGGRKQQQHPGKGGPRGACGKPPYLKSRGSCTHSVQHPTGVLMIVLPETSHDEITFTQSASRTRVDMMQAGGWRGRSCQSSRRRPGRCRLMCCAASRWVSDLRNIAGVLGHPCRWQCVRSLLSRVAC